MDGMSQPDLICCGLREAQVLHLALLYQFLRQQTVNLGMHVTTIIAETVT